MYLGFPGGSDGKEFAYNAGNLGLIHGWGRFPTEGHGNPLQYSCLENPMDKGAWKAMFHRFTKSWTWLRRLSTHPQSMYLEGQQIVFHTESSLRRNRKQYREISDTTREETSRQKLWDQSKEERGIVAAGCAWEGTSVISKRQVSSLEPGLLWISIQDKHGYVHYLGRVLHKLHFFLGILS